MIPETAIRALDRSLVAAGDPVAIVRRGVGGVVVETQVLRARHTPGQTREVAGMVEQSADRFTISPTWNFAPVIGDAVVTEDGREFVVDAIDPTRIRGVVVRLDLVVSG